MLKCPKVALKAPKKSILCPWLVTKYNVHIFQSIYTFKGLKVEPALLTSLKGH